MKLFLSLLLATSTQAYVLLPNVARFGRSSGLHASAHDEAVKEAQQISAKYGATSSEAKVAWDIVEELNASDNSAAYTGGISDSDCLVDAEGEVSQECKEYDAKLKALSELLRNQVEELGGDKNIAESVHPVPLAKPDTVSAKDSLELTSAMTKAVGEAKSATEKYGIASSEAKLAWATVEELASNDSSQATKDALSTEECLVEKLQACEAIEELQRALFLKTSEAQGRYQG